MVKAESELARREKNLRIAQEQEAKVKG